MPLSDAVRAKLNAQIQSTDVVLYMKGNRHFPQCGFSASIVGVLKEVGASFETINVLADPEVREGIKELSGWPTIPQLYVKGEFIGGADIVKEMAADGSLQQLLATTAPPAPPSRLPQIRITPAASEAFAAASDGSDVLHLEIDPQFQNDLFFGPQGPDDLAIDAGALTVYMSPSSARRADGLVIDYVKAGSAQGFRLDNPNDPASVKAP